MKKLFIKLCSRPRFTLIDSDGGIAMADDSQFTDTGYGDWTGFYDWLRRDGIIVGIRYWPFEQSQFLLEAVPSAVDLTIDSVGAILIFLGPVSSFDEETSCDQAFEECRLLQGDAGYALVIGFSDLPAEEAAMLKLKVLNESKVATDGNADGSQGQGTRN